MPGKDLDDFRLDVFWGPFRTLVQDGDIKVGKRDPNEIVAEFWQMVKRAHEERQTEWRYVSDFRQVLIDEARRNETDGMPEMAVMFYALWIEHTVNACLTSGMQRNGYDHEIVSPLIRELRLKTKLTALWHIAGYEPLAETDVVTVEQVTQARNAFVHYKWPEYDGDTRSSFFDRLEEILNRAHNLEDAFDVAVDKRFWCGRKTEIMKAFRVLSRLEIYGSTEEGPADASV